MRAMILPRAKAPLELAKLPDPAPGPGEVVVRVRACGVCRTDLHVMDGELADPKLPLVLGHQVVGVVERLGEGVGSVAVGERVGIPWLGWTCGRCDHCAAGRENLCDDARFVGYQLDGGYAELVRIDARFVLRLPPGRSDLELAPLLCAGLIGFRSYRMAGDGRRLGLYGFGAAAHILCQLARADGREVYAFVRPGDEDAKRFAKKLGAVFAGDSDEAPPHELDAAILFAPAGELVPKALANVRKGGTVVCGGIHMSDIPSFPYSLLWGERMLRSVANLTRRDGEEFFERVGRTPVETEVTVLPLERANEALSALRSGEVTGAVVLEI